METRELRGKEIVDCGANLSLQQEDVYLVQAKQQMQNWRTYYNFVRPHQTLKKTPAEQAGIQINANHNKWLSLIKQSAQWTNPDNGSWVEIMFRTSGQPNDKTGKIMVDINCN